MRIHHVLLGSLLLCFGAGHVGAAPGTLFVATNGNDGWSGRFEQPSSGGQDGPKATLQAALQEVRALRQRQPEQNRWSVVVRGGRYALQESVRLTPELSGSSAALPFTIEAYPGEHPVLSGGRLIEGWQRVEGKPNLWQTEIPEVRAGQWYFRQLFVDGKRAQRARTPNDGFFRVQGGSPKDKPVKLKFQPGDIKAAWASDGDVEVIGLLAWADIRMQIRAVDEGTHLATLSGDPQPSNQEADARYYIENAPDALDRAGEWYLNRKTGVLLYQSEPGQDLSKSEVIAPRLTELLSLQGESNGAKPVHHVSLRGLTFSHADWELGNTGYADTQAAIGIPGDLRASFAVDCVIEDCTFSHLAGYALDLGRGCQRFKVIGNEMTDLGGGGIRVGETSTRAAAFERNTGHVISDNEMHSLGRVYAPAIGVLILQSGQNRVAHNHIYDLYYTAVSVGWNWGYQETPCRENIVEFNHMHDIGQAMLSDMGAVYTLGIQKGTIIRNNVIHDVNSFTYGGWGLYPDEGSTGILWESNVVYRTKSAGFHQHYGRENIVRNNVFAYGKEFQLMRTRDEQHISFIFTNNIVYFDSGALLGSNWKNDQFVIDGNIYFDTRSGPNPEKLKFGGASLAAWRQRGHDANSIVADPQFIAPQQYDFRLREGSPALQRGFHQIDVSQVGVRPKGLRQDDR